MHAISGIVLVWFRWHYDKKLLRNIDEEEFQEFKEKCPERQAIMVQWRGRYRENKRDQGEDEKTGEVPRAPGRHDAMERAIQRD